MTRRQFLMTSAALLPLLAACAVPERHDARGRDSGPRHLTRIGLLAVRHVSLAALNAERAALDLGVLQPSDALDLAALAHARDLAGQGQLSHFGTDTSGPLSRATRVGFRGRLMGEVLARSTDDEITVLQGWLDDPETRAVLLDPLAGVFGIAVHADRAGIGWWVLMTGSDEG